MTTLAHLTDIHMPPLPFPTLRELSLKRFFGLMNWHLSRKYMHVADVLERMVTDLQDQPFDHLIISGDLVNIALQDEYNRAMKWMYRFGLADEVSFVPGNHDYYGANNTLYPDDKNGGGELLPYMTSNKAGIVLGGVSGPELPFVRVINDVALIGINSGVPTPLFKAYGEVSTTALTALKKCLQRAKDKELYRCVIIHHPPLHGITSASRGLNNDRALMEILEEFGAELVLYGHNHRQKHDELPTSSGVCHVIGTPSASVGKSGHYELARYNLFHIEATSLGWKTKMTGRGLDEDFGPVVNLGSQTL